MQAAPKAIGHVPYIPAYPRKQSSNPSQRPLPQNVSRRAVSGSLCGLLIASSLVLAPLALINVTAKAMVAENSYRIQRLENNIEGQKQLSEDIRITNAKMASLERVKSVAINKLAMTEPTVEAKIISLPGNGVTSPEYAFLNTEEER